MRTSLGQRRSYDSLASSTEHRSRSASPSRLLSSSSDHAKRPSSSGKAKGLACAFNALKCTSRAFEEDNFSGSFTANRLSDSEQQIDSSSPGTGSPPLPSPEMRTDRNGRAMKDLQGDETDTSSRLLQMSSYDSVDHAPLFEDPDDGSSANGVRALVPSRTPSDDTHETPNVSNRDPVRSQGPGLSSIQTVHDPAFDEYCQSNFNTPRMLHTNGSLGDSITPIVSPENDCDAAENERHKTKNCSTPKSAIDANAKKALELPNINATKDPVSRDSILSYASSVSSLYGEALTEEKKDSEEFRLSLSSHHSREPEQSGTGIAQQSRQGLPPRTPTYQSLQPDDSSVSSFSSFNDILKQKKEMKQRHSSCKQKDTSKKRRRPAFFWRSHPTVTVYSYDFQNPFSQHLCRNNHSDEDLISISMDSPRGQTRTSPRDGFKTRQPPRLNPAVVREMWMTSKPFCLQVNTNWGIKSNSNRHPQGPPSTRSAAAMIQSFTTFATNKLPGVFARSDSTRLNCDN